MNPGVYAVISLKANLSKGPVSGGLRRPQLAACLPFLIVRSITLALTAV